MTKNDEPITKKYLDKKLEETKGYTDKKFGDLKEEIIGFKDEILTEIKALREDFDTHAFQHQTTNDTLDDHETRLRRLEKPRL